METILYLNASTDSVPYRRKLAGVKRFARVRRWDVQVAYCDRGPLDLAKLIAEVKPVGVIVEACYAQYRMMPQSFGTLPVVYLDMDPSVDVGASGVVISREEDIVATALRAFDSVGAQHLAYVGWFQDEFWSSRRERAFRSLVEARRVPYDVFRSPFREEEQEPYLQSLSAWMTRLPRGTGVLAANDYAAQRTLEAARRAGRDVPRELYVLGVDNDAALCEAANPPLASIQMDFETGGYLAGQLLSDLIADPNLAARTVSFGALGYAARTSLKLSPHMNPRIAGALQLIRDRACEGLKASDVLAHLGGSRRAGEMHFRAAVGTSVLDYIIDVRLRRVCFLLEHSTLSCADIAVLGGFTGEETLRKLFRRRTGLSMTEWRRSRRTQSCL